MAFLTDTDLQGFSDLALDLFMKDTCDIEREPSIATHPDGQGGRVLQSTWTVLNTNPVPCAVLDTPKAPRDLIDDTQLISNPIKLIVLPRFTDVKNQDRLRVNGVTVYRVIASQDPTTYEVVRRVYVTRDELEEVS